MASHYRKKVRQRQRGGAVGRLKNSLVRSGSGGVRTGRTRAKDKERNTERKVLGEKRVSSSVQLCCCLAVSADVGGAVPQGERS